MTDVPWRKASYSSDGGSECVECADFERVPGLSGRVGIRDSKGLAGSALALPKTAARDLLIRIKQESTTWSDPGKRTPGGLRLCVQGRLLSTPAASHGQAGAQQWRTTHERMAQVEPLRLRRRRLRGACPPAPRSCGRS
ncbi:DUF397 domain-containing protein [Actinomadura harenae]|uniref:DUF397 domain-containing protein n=1 Tax=Actinomadura harenae TaxID=2483351 RepID=A0A3M2M1Y9_9ACTN|nr:DUF397 domain-containing protein [Actinomadura harenae]